MTRPTKNPGQAAGHHVCGLQGWHQELDGSCPGCVPPTPSANESEREHCERGARQLRELSDAGRCAVLLSERAAAFSTGYERGRIDSWETGLAGKYKSLQSKHDRLEQDLAAEREKYKKLAGAAERVLDWFYLKDDGRGPVLFANLGIALLNDSAESEGDVSQLDLLARLERMTHERDVYKDCHDSAMRNHALRDYEFAALRAERDALKARLKDLIEAVRTELPFLVGPNPDIHEALRAALSRAEGK